MRIYESMRMPRIQTALLILSFGILAMAISFSLYVVAEAQTDDEMGARASEAGITFPVAELGNCGSKQECKKFCDSPDNMEACIAFAEKHSLMNKEEASRAKKFSEKMRSGGGPGGCKSPRECQQFCGNLANIETCVAFAEEHGGPEGQDIAEAKKVAAYIKSGGKMPGGCSSKESCEAYCGDATHVEECIAFAEKAGVGPRDGGGRPEDIEKFKKFSALVKSGETPGGCTSKDTCEKYCGDEANQEECLAFGKKMGFVDEHREQFFRENRGKGPGGCTSRESCTAFCNEPANRETCFQFGEQNGLLRKEDVEQSKEGLVRLRSGLEQAPPEVSECLKAAVGPNIIEDIQSGKLVPGREIGERVRTCFERSGEHGPPRQMFKDAPPAIAACAGEKLGADAAAKIKSGEAEFTPEAADAFRVCFQQQQFEGGFENEGPRGEPHEGRPEGMSGGFGNFARTAPPEIRSCFESNLGGDFVKLESGELSPESVKDKLHSCFESFKPQMPPQGMPPEGGLRQPADGGPGDQNFRGRPEGIGGERQGMPPAGMMREGQMQGQKPVQQFPRAEYEEKCKANPEACKNFGAPFFEHQQGGEQRPPDFQQKLPYMGEPPRTGEYRPMEGGEGMYKPPEGMMQSPMQQQYQQHQQFQQPMEGQFQPPTGSMPPSGSTMPPPGGTMPPPPSGSEPSGGTSGEMPPPGSPSYVSVPAEQTPPPGSFMYRPSLFARIMEILRGR